MGGRNLGELLAQSCARWPDQVAVEDARQAIAYSQLDDLSSSIARKLEERGLEQDEPAIVLVSNDARDWISVLALWRARGVMVPVHRTTPGPAFQEVLA